MQPGPRLALQLQMRVQLPQEAARAEATPSVLHPYSTALPRVLLEVLRVPEKVLRVLRVLALRRPASPSVKVFSEQRSFEVERLFVPEVETVATCLSLLTRPQELAFVFLKQVARLSRQLTRLARLALLGSPEQLGQLELELRLRLELGRAPGRQLELELGRALQRLAASSVASPPGSRLLLTNYSSLLALAAAVLPQVLVEA